MSDFPDVTRNGDGSVSLVWTTDRQTALSISSDLLEHMVGSIDDARRPFLTAAERDAVASAAAAFDASDYPDANRKADTLRGLLERLGGGK